MDSQIEQHAKARLLAVLTPTASRVERQPLEGGRVIRAVMTDGAGLRDFA